MIKCIAVCGPVASGKSKVVRSLQKWFSDRGFSSTCVSLSQQAFLDAFKRPTPPSYTDAARAIMEFVSKKRPMEYYSLPGVDVVILERWFIDWIAFGLIDVIRKNGSPPFFNQFLSSVMRGVRRSERVDQFLVILLRHPSRIFGFGSKPPEEWPETRKAAYVFQDPFPGVWDAAAIICKSLVEGLVVVKSPSFIKSESDADMLVDRVMSQYFLD